MDYKKGKLKNSSINLAIQVINLYDRIQGKAFLKNQMARSATSVGANIHEADYAESPEDFVHKLKIALKECHETEYWMHVLSEACPDLAEVAMMLRKEAGNIRYMLIASINTVQGRE